MSRLRQPAGLQRLAARPRGQRTPGIALAALLLLAAGTGRTEAPSSAPSAGPNAAASETPPARTGATLTALERAVELLRGFHFGTYGRVGLSADLERGSRARPLNVVSHGPRLEEPPYAELDLGYALTRQHGLGFRVLFTLGLLEQLFHYDGEFDASLAVRNLYAEATHVLIPGLSLWVGSRMYRGDDIYLLDYWPLDNLNTLGGGARLQLGRTELKLHVGVNRLDDLYQFQRVTIPGATFGTREVVVLDRQRTIVSAKASHDLPKVAGDLSLKVAGYGELHHLPPGRLRRDIDDPVERLPSDLGYVVGLQLGAWGFARASFVNLWIRYAGGLAAYGEHGIPFGLDQDKRTTGAKELVLALSANYERGMVGLMLGGYTRYFEDADGVDSDPDDGWEGVVVVRPHLFLHRHLHGVFELSYQVRRPNGLDPASGSHLVPGVFKASVMPTLSWDRGSLARPQLRLVYTVSYLDEGARRGFPAPDPRRGVAVRHFVGAQVEWWYNSSYR